MHRFHLFCLAWLSLHPARPYSGILYQAWGVTLGATVSENVLALQLLPKSKFHIPLIPSLPSSKSSLFGNKTKSSRHVLVFLVSKCGNTDFANQDFTPWLGRHLCNSFERIGLVLTSSWTLHVLEQSNEWQIFKQHTKHTRTQRRVVTIYDGKANVSLLTPSCCLGPAMLTLCWWLVPKNMPIW